MEDVIPYAELVDFMAAWGWRPKGEHNLDPGNILVWIRDDDQFEREVTSVAPFYQVSGNGPLGYPAEWLGEFLDHITRGAARGGISSGWGSRKIVPINAIRKKDDKKH